jgi:hypothetical protein
MPQALSLLRHPMVALSHFLAHFSASSSRWTSTWGMIGACIYFASFAFPLQGNIPLLGFALCSTLAIAASTSVRTPGWTPLTLAIVAFISATAVSTLVSVDLGRSLRLSTPFLPALLLFFVVTTHCAGPQDIRRLYLALSVVGLGLAVTVVWGAWTAPHGLSLLALVPRLGSPILVVPNDVTFLALVAPLSLVLLVHEPRGVVRVLAALSLCFSVGAVCLLHSRTAVLTLLIALTCTSLLLQRKRRLALGLACPLMVVLCVLCIEGALGFPLAAKFSKLGSVQWRITESLAAWELFLTAPVFGHGPHTYGLFRQVPWVHNLYAEVLAEQGLLGLTALGSLLACGLGGGWTLRRVPAEDTRLLGAGALASLVGLCAAGGVELTLLREWVVTMLFMLLGVIGHLISRQPQRGSARKWSIALERIALLKGGLPWRTVPPR